MSSLLPPTKTVLPVGVGGGGGDDVEGADWSAEELRGTETRKRRRLLRLLEVRRGRGLRKVEEEEEGEAVVRVEGFIVVPPSVSVSVPVPVSVNKRRRWKEGLFIGFNDGRGREGLRNRESENVDRKRRRVDRDRLEGMERLGFYAL